jgi:hypothetical protein
MEFVSGSLSKQVSGTARRQVPASGNVFGIAPDQFKKGTFVRDFLFPINGSHLI